MKTGKLILVFVLLLSVFSAKAQTDEVGKIALSVVMPYDGELNLSQLSKLESKIIQITSKAGLSAAGFSQTFVIYPKFTVYETNVVEGGMQNITVVTAELSLFIRHLGTDMIFSSVSKPLKGSGRTKEMAITNAIAQIPVADKAFAAFIETGKQKIVAYYEANCDNIIKKADSYIQMQQYAPALGLLMSIPDEISSCYDKVIDKSIATFKAYQNQVCAENIQQAKAKSAAMDYDGALEILAAIDPSSKCAQEQQALIKSLESKVSAEEKKHWDFLMKQYNNEVGLEKQRIDAVKAIAVEYYKSQQVDVNYNILIK